MKETTHHMEELYKFSHTSNKKIDKLVETYASVSKLCEAVRIKSESLVWHNIDLMTADDQNRSIRRCSHAAAKMILEQKVALLQNALNQLKAVYKTLSDEMDNPDSFIKEEDYEPYRDNSAGHGRTNRAITAYYLLAAISGIKYANDEVLAEARENLLGAPPNDIQSIEERWKEIRSEDALF
jgi:hypothetical protein